MPGTHIPRVKKDPRPHRTAMERAAAARVRIDVMVNDLSPQELSLKSYRRRYGQPEDTEAELRVYQERDALAFEDSRTWTGAVWALREAEQKVTDLKRAEYVARYRPIQTLDGLDPYPSRSAKAQRIAEMKALFETMRKVFNYG